MAMLNLNSVLTSPMLATRFTVVRRDTVVNGYGETELNKPRTIGPLCGVLNPASPDQLQRLPDMQYFEKAITVVTRYGLRGVCRDSSGVQQQPDIVEWPVGSKSYFIVQLVDDYSHVGSGYVHCLCTSIESIDAAPVITAEPTPAQPGAGDLDNG